MLADIAGATTLLDMRGVDNVVAAKKCGIILGGGGSGSSDSSDGFRTLAAVPFCASVVAGAGVGDSPFDVAIVAPALASPPCVLTDGVAVVAPPLCREPDKLAAGGLATGMTPSVTVCSGWRVFPLVSCRANDTVRDTSDGEEEEVPEKEEKDDGDDDEDGNGVKDDDGNADDGDNNGGGVNDGTDAVAAVSGFFTPDEATSDPPCCSLAFSPPPAPP